MGNKLSALCLGNVSFKLNPDICISVLGLPCLARKNLRVSQHINKGINGFAGTPSLSEKGSSDITNSVDQDQPLHDIENSYT